MRFLTERGQNVNGQPNIIYVSSDNGSTWMPLHEFVDVSISAFVLGLCFDENTMTDEFGVVYVPNT